MKDDQMQLCKLASVPTMQSQSMYISNCVVIKFDFTALMLAIVTGSVDIAEIMIMLQNGAKLDLQLVNLILFKSYKRGLR